MNQPDEKTALLMQMHADQKRVHSRLFGLLLIPGIGFFLFPSAVPLWLGAAYLAGCCIYLSARKKRIRSLYEEISRSRLEWLFHALREAGYGTSTDRLAYGYLQTGENTGPVLLHIENDALHVFDNPLIKNCVYAVENDFCYILDPAGDEPVRTKTSVPLANARFETSPLNHRDFLVDCQHQTGMFASAEMFVYDHLLRNAMTGTPQPMLNCVHALSLKRKEPVFTAALPGTGTLHIPAKAFRSLAIAG